MSHVAPHGRLWAMLNHLQRTAMIKAEMNMKNHHTLKFDCASRPDNQRERQDDPCCVGAHTSLGRSGYISTSKPAASYILTSGGQPLAMF